MMKLMNRSAVHMTHFLGMQQLQVDVTLAQTGVIRRK